MAKFDYMFTQSERAIVFLDEPEKEFALALCRDTRIPQVHIDLRRFNVKRGDQIILEAVNDGHKYTASSVIFDSKKTEIESFRVDWYNGERGFGYALDVNEQSVFFHRSVLLNYMRYLGRDTRNIPDVTGIRGHRHFNEKGDIICYIDSADFALIDHEEKP